MKNQLLALETQYRLHSYFKRWYIFILCITIFLAGAWLYLHYETPIYRISSTLLIIDDKKGDGLLKTTAFSDLNMFQGTRSVDNEIEILRSKDLLEQVFLKLNMGVSYFDEKSFKTEELYGAQLPFVVTVMKYDGKPIKEKILITAQTDSTVTFNFGKSSSTISYGTIISKPGFVLQIARGPAEAQIGNAIRIRLNNIAAMAANYSVGRLQVNPVIKESNTLRITTTDAIPERGLAILTQMIETYNQENIDKKNATAIATIAFIDKRLKTLEADLSGVEVEVETYKQQNQATEVSAGTQVNLAKLAEYSQLMEGNNVQLGIINTLSSNLKDSEKQFNMVSSMGLKEPVLNTLVNRFNELQLERNRMLNSAKLNNPLVEELTEQVNNMKQNIRENLENVKKGVEIEQNFLKSNSLHYNSRIKSVPSLERGLLQRGREQIVKTNLYDYLLQKREETALSLSATIPSSQLIDRPSINPIPEFPKPPLTYLLGGILGFLLPIGLIYASENFRPKVTSRANLHQIGGIKILGELTHHSEPNPIAIKEGSTTSIAELFRFIRMNIGQFGAPALKKTILVTSCAKGEGKTFFSLNLGITLAQLDKKVLILEFDLRQPSLLNMLNMPQKAGISTYLSGRKEDLIASIQRCPNTANLDVLGCGPLPINPAELLYGEHVETLFDELKNIYDYIIVDTSPVGTVADAFSLAGYADLSIYLVRYNYTNISQLEILKDINENDKLGNLMVVLNDAKQVNRSRYAYGGYGYASARPQ